jgi:hypothetical protein
MAVITTLTFVKAGEEPKQRRNTESQKMVDDVLSQLKSWPTGQSLVVSTDGKKKGEAYGLARRLNKQLDPKKAVAYRTGTQVVVTRFSGK